MSRIDGLDDVTAGKDPDGDGPLKAPDPKSKELSGLKKVDDNTFTVKLSAPFSGFPATIGYSGFFPVAKACLDNFDACNETPIGNGPYKIDGKWNHDDSITLVRNADYAGAKTDAKADKLVYKIFADVGAGYDAFTGGRPRRDVHDAAGEGQGGEEHAGRPLLRAGRQLHHLPRRSRCTTTTSRTSGSARRISMAIDRQAIIDAVFDGRFHAATGVVSPNFDGYREGVCKYCKKDVDAAKKLLADAGGWKGGKLQLWANAGAGHDKWMQAVGDQLKANLGIDYELKINLQFPQYLETMDNNGLTGPFRLRLGSGLPVHRDLHGSAVRREGLGEQLALHQPRSSTR